MTSLWDQRDKNYHKRDLKSKLWDEIGEKLTVAGKYWNNNTNETDYYLQTYSIFNIGAFYIRMVAVVANIYLSYTLYIKNVPYVVLKWKIYWFCDSIAAVTLRCVIPVVCVTNGREESVVNQHN